MRFILTLTLLFAVTACRSGSQETSSPPFDNSLPTQGDPTTPPIKEESNYLYESIPGSTLHRKATWWGYNQSKIVRNGSTVYMTVSENNVTGFSPLTLSVYRKVEDDPWKRVLSFSAHQTGNILVDSSGTLHVFIFVATDDSVSDSIGRLEHHFYPGGDLTQHHSEVVIDNNGSEETVNVRIGASLGSDDTMLIAFGVTLNGSGETEQLWTKKPGDLSWIQHVAGTHLGHDYYYPFPLMTRTGFSILAVQDDYVGAGLSNIYQHAKYFEYTAGVWSARDVADVRSNALATTRPRMVEQSDLHEDSQGRVHVIVKRYLHAENTGQALDFEYQIRSNGVWSTRHLDLYSYGINWLKVVDIGGGEVVLLGTSYDRIFVVSSDGSRVREIETTFSVQGIYPYVDRTTSTLDVLIISGDSSAYPSPDNAYLRIEKSLLKDLLNS